MLRGQLGEKIRPLEIHGDYLVKDILRRLDDVGANAGSDARVVDKGVEATKCGECFIHEALAVGGEPDISTDDGKFLGAAWSDLTAGGGGFIGGGAVVRVVDGDAVAGGGEFDGDSTTETTTRSGDKDIGWWVHAEAACQMVKNQVMTMPIEISTIPTYFLRDDERLPPPAFTGARFAPTRSADAPHVPP